MVRKIGYILNMPSNSHYHQMEHIISQTHMMEQYLTLLRGSYIHKHNKHLSYLH
jgi:hypothetical protein